MADVDSGAVSGDGGKAGVDIVFRLGIKGGRGLVEDDERRVPVQRASEGDLLLLPAREQDPILVKSFVDIGVRSVRKFADPFSESRLLKTERHPFRIVFARRHGKSITVMEPVKGEKWRIRRKR